MFEILLPTGTHVWQNLSFLLCTWLLVITVKRSSVGNSIILINKTQMNKSP